MERRRDGIGAALTLTLTPMCGELRPEAWAKWDGGVGEGLPCLQSVSSVTRRRHAGLQDELQMDLLRSNARD